jgi:branched-subunit amino acid aminotransferase/4-amino-4-deoxychorismate lyase
MDECDVGLKDIFAADEAAVCSSVAGIVPVVAVDGRQIGNGLPGARSMAMREARERWIDEFSRATGATPPGIQATAKSSG